MGRKIWYASGVQGNINRAKVNRVMDKDFTEFQSIGEQDAAQRLSLQSNQPPSDVPGYRLERRLGQGAFGQVWVGYDLNTGRQVAIKFYLHRTGVNWALSREVKHLVTMSTNRHIVQVLQVGWEGDPPYYIMEYLENGSLEDLLRRERRLSVTTSVSMFTDIAKGLNHSHGKGVLHCDLKPANILLDQDFRPRLADFGQSRMSTEQSPALGTLFYMAPEQADLSASPDARWDVYALGAILYAMLVGEPPYRSDKVLKDIENAKTITERLERYRRAIFESPPPRELQKTRGVDRALIQIIQRCIAREPERRFANVQQVLEALSQRQALRLRRPLQLLGVVGPLLLVAVMSFFAVRSIRLSEAETLQRLQTRALESNRFAARFAARSIESELVEVYRLLEEEVRTREFQERFREAHEATEAGRAALVDSHDYAAVPKAFREQTQRQWLDQYLRELTQRWSQTTSNQLLSKLNSLFVTDAAGTTFSAAFREKTSDEQSPVGKNFAYRSYFNGGRDDASSSRKAADFKPISDTHLSAAFKSTSTGTWKVAVSTPVWLDEASAENSADVPDASSDGKETRGKVLGVFCLTIELSDISILADGDFVEEDKSQIAVLIDGRDGVLKGTLLYHPLLEQMARSPMGSEIARDGRFQIDEKTLERLQSSGIFDYQDPVATTIPGKEFEGDWIATVEKVRLPVAANANGSTNGRSESDLWMLVQERASNVTDPVRQLSSRLAGEGAAAVATIVAVICMLWLIVWRVLRPAEKSIWRAMRAESGKDSSLGSTAETIEQWSPP